MASSKSGQLSQEEQLERALTEKRENPELSLRNLASRYSIPRSSLQDQFHGTPTRQQAREKQQCLSTIEEESLVKWINLMHDWGWPPRISTLMDMATCLLVAKGDPKPLGQHWYQNFLACHPDLKLKYSCNLDQS